MSRANPRKSEKARHPRRRFLSLTIVAIVAVLGTTVGAAAAVFNFVPNNNYAPTCFSTNIGSGVPCQTDNTALSYYMKKPGESYAVSQLGQDRVNKVMREEYNPTDLNATYDSTPVYTGGSETDIVIGSSTEGIPSSADGVYWCNGQGNTQWACDQGMVRIEPAYFDRYLICHEVGHGVGLTHGANAEPAVSQGTNSLACMTTPVETTALGTDNKANINFWY